MWVSAPVNDNATVRSASRSLSPTVLKSWIHPSQRPRIIPRMKAWVSLGHHPRLMLAPGLRELGPVRLFALPAG